MSIKLQSRFYSCIVVLILAMTSITNAQMNYSFQQSTEVFTPITGGTIVATASGIPQANDSALDSRVYTLTAGTIPFSFYFNGSTYNSLSISSNGFITLGGSPSTTNVNPIGSTAIGGGSNGYYGAIVPFGRDLVGTFKNFVPGDPDTIAQIRYQVLGTAPNRKFVVQWRNFRPSGTNLIPNMTIQARLSEGNGICEYVYGEFSGATWTNSTTQVGLRGPNNTIYVNRSLASGQPWTNTIPGTTNVSSVAFTTASLPASGTVFSFIPSCPVPSNLSILDLLSTSVKLRWNSGSGAGSFPGSNYTVEYGLQGFTLGTGTIVNTNDTFLNVARLIAGQTYQYYVKRNCTPSGNGISANSNPKSFTTGLPAEDCSLAITVGVAADLGSCTSTIVASGSSQNGPNAICSDALGGNFPDDDKWYKFVAPGNGKKIVVRTTAGTVNDWVMEVWNNCNSSGGISIKCSDDVNGGMPEITLCQNEYTPGQTYYIRAWTYSLTANGDMSLCVFEDSPCPIAPAYDECESAASFPINAVLLCPGSEMTFTTLFATPTGVGGSFGAAPSCDGTSGLNDVFLTFNTGSTGNFNITFNKLSATDLRAQLLFECGSGGFEIECWSPAEGTHSITGLNPSANYVIRVWSAVGQSGTFSVCASDACDDPTATISGSSTICTTGVAQLRVDLTGVPPWNVVYSDGVSNFNFVTSTTPYFIAVSPIVTTFYNLVSVTSAICSGTVGGVSSVNVVQPPTVTLASFPNSVCLNTIYTLSGGSPVGGVYSGIGVSGSQFNTNTAGVGTHNITYTYGIGNGCQRSDTKPITVISSPIITSLNPSVSQVGTTITITGTGFTNITNVRFNNTFAITYNVVNSTTITAVVPVGATTGFITVFSSNGCNAQSPTTFGVGNPPGLTLNVRALVEGYHIGGGIMNAVVDPALLPNKSDTFKLELHNTSAPFGLVLTRLALANLDGTFSVSIPGAQANNSYYLVIKGRNIVETWSKVPKLLLSGTNLYDFTIASSPLMRVMNNTNSGASSSPINSEYDKPEHPE
ncbi:MAG: fibronectin type III domain-containing protein [Bacteroidetes bacterium]|nr:fibronectin type III domain-containing protein [Bacteroidota bacterium]